MRRKRLIVAGLSVALLTIAATGAGLYAFWAPSAALPPLGAERGDAPQIAVADANAAKPNSVKPSRLTSDVLRSTDHIFRLQTRLARGDDMAEAALQDARAQLRRMLQMNAKGRRTTLELQALAMDVLSGGDPAGMEKHLGDEQIARQDRALLGAALAYAKGQSSDAEKAFAELAGEALPSLVRAQVMLARAQISTTSEYASRLSWLSQAASLAPGTLVEEAAIRRLVGISAAAKDHERFLYWAGRYARRFANSHYASDFEQGVVRAATALDESLVKLDAGELRILLHNVGRDRAVTFARAMLLAAIARGDSKACSKIQSSLVTAEPGETGTNADVQALTKICAVIQLPPEDLAHLTNAERRRYDTVTFELATDAVKMSEAIQHGGSLHAAPAFGPDPPLLLDLDHGRLAASVAQQMDASLLAINKADGHETSSDTGP
jgi:hypothetical protein